MSVMKTINLFERNFDQEAAERERLRLTGEDRVYSLAEHQQAVDAAVLSAREEAFLQGHAAGVAKTESEIGQQVANAAGALIPLLQVITTELPDHKRALEGQMVDLAYNVFSKLAPVFAQQMGPELIAQLVGQRLARLSEGQVLAVKVAPGLVAPVGELVAGLGDTSAACSLSVEPDEELGPADVRVEWRNGFMEHRVSTLIEEIEAMLRPTQQQTQNTTEQPEE